jgi:hypothetical protein
MQRNAYCQSFSSQTRGSEPLNQMQVEAVPLHEQQAEDGYINEEPDMMELVDEEDYGPGKYLIMNECLSDMLPVQRSHRNFDLP